MPHIANAAERNSAKTFVYANTIFRLYRKLVIIAIAAVVVPTHTVIAAKGCKELWLNPGTESDEVLAEAERLGLQVIQACSIVGLGVSPATL